MGSCVNFPPPAGSKCSIIECKSFFNSLKNDWELSFCPINTADNRFCADVMPSSQSQFCIDNQSFGLMTQPTQIWTYGCSANFTVCSMPAKTPSLGPTSYPSTTAYPTTPTYPITNNQPRPVGPVTNTPASSAISSSSTAYTTAHTDFRTSSSRPTRYSQSDDNSANKIGSVDSSIVIGCAVAGAIILVLLVVLLLVFLRRRRSKKNGNTSDIEWDDYTGKSRNQNGGNTTGVDISTLPVRNTTNGNDKPSVNGLQPSNGNQPAQEQFINGHDNKGYNQQDTNGQTNGQSNGKTPETNGGFSV